MTPILICGGGPVGLTLALSIAAWDVPVVLVERHPSVSPFPKGRALSTRTMEIFRRMGLEDELTDRAMDRREVLGFFYGTSLSDPDHVRLATGPPPDGSPLSPTFTLPCSQDILEEILRRRVAEHPAIDARFGATVIDVVLPDAPTGAPDAEAVVAVQGPDGSIEELRCRWVVAADGAASGLRDAAGIGRQTFGQPAEHVNILFGADLGPLIRDRASLVYTISDEGQHATLLPIDGRHRWLCNVTLHDGTAQSVAADGTWCADQVRRAIGAAADRIAVEVVDAVAWTATAANAETYRRGPLLLVGDAAHVATPHGGFGMNCGIADADSLGWKLASATIDPELAWLVDTHDPERRPVGEATAIESARRLASAIEGHHSGRTARGEVAPNPSEGLVLGAVYRSAAVIADGTGPAETTVPAISTYEPTATPGARAPHVTLADGRSTLDLFGTHHTVLRTSPVGEPGMAEPLGALRVEEVMVGDALDPSGAVRALYELGPGGAVVVRPDGHVSARTCSDPQQGR